MKTKIISAIIADMFFLMNFGFTQDYWEHLNSPPDARIYSVASNSGSDIYIGISSPVLRGVHRSTDNGNTWEYIGLTSIIGTLFINSEDHIYAGSGGIYFSPNDGSTWDTLSTSIGTTSLYVDDNLILAGVWGGIYRTENHGIDWYKSLDLVNSEVVNAIIKGPNGNLYAGTTNFISGGGVYQSLDGGETWENIGLADYYVWSLAMNSSGDLFAGTRGTNQFDTVGVFLLPYGQTNWINVFNERYVTSIVINSEDEIYIGLSTSEALYGGAKRSRDNGVTWESINSGLGDINVEKLILDKSEHLIAVARWNSTALYRSVNSTVPAFILDGRITYPNANSSSLSNIELALMQGDSLISSTITNDAGHYSFDSLDNGMYTLVPSASKPWGGVTAMDVLLYQKHIAGISPLSGIYLASGDVNGSGTITAVDMLLIKKRIAGMTGSFPVGDWLFNNGLIEINDSNVNYNFNGICFGDANGSYVIPEK